VVQEKAANSQTYEMKKKFGFNKSRQGKGGKQPRDPRTLSLQKKRQNKKKSEFVLAWTQSQWPISRSTWGCEVRKILEIKLS
jgi:hypothetical protein